MSFALNYMSKLLVAGRHGCADSSLPNVEELSHITKPGTHILA